MKASSRILWVFLLSVAVSSHAAKPVERNGTSLFRYDSPDRPLQATMPANRDCYDPHVAVTPQGTWHTWLTFVPGTGDVLHVAAPLPDGTRTNTTVGAPGRYARPTLTADNTGNLWLTYERTGSDNRDWNLVARRHLGNGTFSTEQVVANDAGNEIAHRTAPARDGGLWTVWQADRDGQFDIVARRTGGDEPTGPVVLSQNPAGDWQPAVAVCPNGDVVVAWDAFDGTSYNVVTRRLTARGWSPVQTIAASPAFEARVDLAADSRGRVWAAWEEGATNWGRPFRAREGRWDNGTDARGPLHRYRFVRLACLQPDGSIRAPAAPLPLPGMKHAAARNGRWPGITYTGVFYEQPCLAIDAADGLWIAYAHYARPELGTESPLRHHIEEGWQIYARRLQGDTWSALYGFNIKRRDGTQRLSIATGESGLAAAWATGRTDRDADPHPRGVAVGHVADRATRAAATAARAQASAPPPPATTPRPARPRVELGGKTYELFLGDLHRHTDLSLCFPYFDGSVDDAYRYAIDVADLDFLGITDHTRDLDRGNALGQLWWRCVKAVTRHDLRNRFIPYFAYERSHGDTDHNVVSLRANVLQNFPPPLHTFWEQIDRDTFTIPHAPINATKCWAYHDDDKRPLLEIFQGCRNYASLDQAEAGLARGYHVGFIASSDHLSTSASYAGVWSPAFGHEPVFRAMQARRTYGATDRIQLVFRTGDHWMGERVTTTNLPVFQLEVTGTAPVAEIRVFRDGECIRTEHPTNSSHRIELTHTADPALDGTHHFYVALKQTDGNEAWSSPLWVTYDNPTPSPARRFREALPHLRNLAQGRPVTTSFQDKITAGAPAMVTDTKKDQHLGHGAPGPAWVQIDLGSAEAVGHLRVWHYYRDRRSYHGNRIALSATGAFAGEETVIFDSDRNGEYAESPRGKLFSFAPVEARYIRNWLTDNSVNTTAQWIEIEAYAPLPPQAGSGDGNDK